MTASSLLKEVDVDVLWLVPNFNVTEFHIPLAEVIMTWMLFVIELPVVCLAIYRLYFMTRTDRFAPVIIINLLISDLIQICCKPVIYVIPLSKGAFVLSCVYYVGISANIGFMVGISFERFVMITYPVWYRMFHSLKYSILSCLVIWMVCLIETGMHFAMLMNGHTVAVFVKIVILLLLPYPLVLFSFVGSWRALSRSVSVTPDERKRVLTLLALVLFNYTVMFLPVTILNVFVSVSLENWTKSSITDLRVVAGLLMYMNPLVDCLMYVFMRKDVKSLLKYFCHKTSDRNTNQTLNTVVRERDVEDNE